MINLIFLLLYLLKHLSEVDLLNHLIILSHLLTQIIDNEFEIFNLPLKNFYLFVSFINALLFLFKKSLLLPFILTQLSSRHIPLKLILHLHNLFDLSRNFLLTFLVGINK